MRKLGSTCVAMALATLVGCNSHYQPRPGPRISQVLRNGQITYVRDGVDYPHGFFGSGLVRAVHGVPEAERAARTYHDRGAHGLLMYLLSSACLVGGAVWLAAEAVQENDRGDGDFLLPSAVTIGCTAGLFVSLGYMLSGLPYREDAINIYNDSIEGPSSPPGWRGPPGQWGEAPPDDDDAEDDASSPADMALSVSSQ